MTPIDEMTPQEQWELLQRRRRMRIALIILGILLLLALVAASLQIQEVHIEGNSHYTTAELETMIFPDAWDRNPFVFYVREKQGKSPRIAFVDRYTVEFTGLQSVDIIVYEKEIVGYLDVMETHMYFDRDGYVVESTAQLIDNVPQFTGLPTDHVALNEELPIKDASILHEVLNISQFLQVSSITWNGTETPLMSLVETVYIDEDGHATCRLGTLEVYLGDGKNMEEKLLTMADILPNLYGMYGTLYLDSFSPSDNNPSYVFQEKNALDSEENTDSEDGEETSEVEDASEDEDASDQENTGDGEEGLDEADLPDGEAEDGAVSPEAEDEEGQNPSQKIYDYPSEIGE